MDVDVFVLEMCASEVAPNKSRLIIDVHMFIFHSAPKTPLFRGLLEVWHLMGARLQRVIKLHRHEFV